MLHSWYQELNIHLIPSDKKQDNVKRHRVQMYSNTKVVKVEKDAETFKYKKVVSKNKDVDHDHPTVRLEEIFF